jgi:hypothetical protein
MAIKVLCSEKQGGGPPVARIYTAWFMTGSAHICAGCYNPLDVLLCANYTVEGIRKFLSYLGYMLGESFSEHGPNVDGASRTGSWYHTAELNADNGTLGHGGPATAGHRSISTWLLLFFSLLYPVIQLYT